TKSRVRPPLVSLSRNHPTFGKWTADYQQQGRHRICKWRNSRDRWSSGKFATRKNCVGLFPCFARPDGRRKTARIYVSRARGFYRTNLTPDVLPPNRYLQY